MADSVNAFTVYSSLELQINEFVQQLNRASQLLDSTLQNMSGAVSSLNVQPVEIRTEANTNAIQDVESAVSGINVPPVTIHTETEPIEPVTVPPPDNRTFIQKIKDSFNTLKNVVNSVPTNIALKFTEMEIKIRNTVNSIPSNIVGKFKEMGTNVVNIFKSFPSNIAAKFSEMKNAAVDKIKELPSNIAGIITSIPSKIGSGLKTIGTNIANAFKSGVESAKNTLKELPAKAAEILKETGEKLKNIAETVSKAALAAVGAASAAVVAFGKKSVDAGMNFDKSMSQVAATMGKSVNEVADLRAFAQEMGRTTAFSATESADALNYMALAGYDAETSMKMLPNVLNLASAGGMDLALASDMITDSQSALGLSLDETTQLVDKMAKASSNSNTSVSQLGDAILTVGGTAKKLKGGTTELSTVLGILADNGIKGSEGGTALRNMMNSLISPTNDAIAMLDAMGTSLYDSEGNMRSLNDVFIDLRNGMSGLATQAEKDQVLTTIFNARDLKSAEALIANCGDRFNELSSAIDDSASVADAMAKTQLDNLAGDVTLFKSALEGAEIAISDHLTPALRDFVQMGSNAMSEIALAFSNSDDFEEAVFKMGRYMQKYIYQFIGKIADAIPKVITVATTLINSLGQAIVKNIPKVANSAVELLKGFAEDITKNAPTAIKGFSNMLKSVSKWLKTNGKTLISAGMEMIKSIATGISDNLSDMTGTVTEIITFIGEMISDNLTLLLDSALNIIGAIGQGIINNLPNLVDSALNIVTSLGEYLIEKIPVLVDKAPEIVESLVDALGNCGEKMVTAADNLMTKFAETIGLSEQWEEIKNSVKGAFDNISTSFSDMKEALQPLKDAFDKLKDKIFGTETKSGLLKKAINLLCSIISKTIGIIGKVISGFMNFVTWLNSGTTGAYVLKSAIESVAATITLTLIGGAIKSLIATLPILLTHIATQTAALVANAAAWIAAAAPILGIVAAISAVIFIGKLLIDNWDEIKTFCIGVWNEMQDRLIDFWENLDIGWHTIWNSITGFFRERTDDLKTGWKSITDFFKEKIDDWKTGIQSIKNFFTSLKDHINTIFGAIGRFISGLVDNWESGAKSIKDWVENLKKKIGELPEKFKELVDGALNWGRDLIENFMQGAKEKIEAWNSFWEDVGFTIYDLLHHSTPEKGPLKDDDKWGGDLMDNLINGVKSKEKSLADTIKYIAENIRETFSDPISVNAGVHAKGTLSGFELPDISADTSVPFVADGSYMTRYKSVQNPPVSSYTENNRPIIVENMNINMEGMTFSSEYEMNRFIDFLHEKLKAKNIRDNRGVGGVMF